MSEITTIVLCSLSSLFSSSVILTGLMFPSIMLNPSNPFSNILFIISVCDCIGCLGLSFGFPHDGTDLCTAQAFLRILFFPSTWIWSTALVFHLHSMIIYKKLHVSMMQTHIVCWTTVLAVNLLPLIQSSLGISDELSGKLSCLYRFHTSYAILWIYGIRFSFFFTCLLLKIFFIYKVHVYLKSKASDECVKEKLISRSIHMYPNALIVTKTLLVVLLFFDLIGFDLSVITKQISIMIASQYGLVCAIIFFKSSTMARQKWYTLIFGVTSSEGSVRDSQSTESSNRQSFFMSTEELSPSIDLMTMSASIISRTWSKESDTSTVFMKEMQLNIMDRQSHLIKSPMHDNM